MKKQVKVTYEARLNRSIRRTNSYGVKKNYKKGTVLYTCPEKHFQKINSKNIEDYATFCICEGYGVYEYFDLKEDIQFFKVTEYYHKTETKANLKK